MMRTFFAPRIWQGRRTRVEPLQMQIELLEQRCLLSNSNLVQYVNPFIGTNPAPTGVGGFDADTGDVFPGAVTPFGMVQFSPDTSPDNIPGGYWYPDSTIRSFSLTHFSGGGDTSETDFGFLPVNGSLSGTNSFSFSNYYAGFSHVNEQASPGFYQVALNTGDTVALTATTRTGFMQTTFPSSTSTGTILLNIGNSVNGVLAGQVNFVSSNEITGDCESLNIGGESYWIYFDAVFNQSVIASGTWTGSSLTPGSTAATGGNTGAYLTFATGSSNNIVDCSVGISYVSIANAKLNRTTEVGGSWNFDTIQQAAASAWNTDLSTVQINDPNASTASLTTFYTSLYHTMIDPSIFDDVNGEYIGFDGVIRTLASGHHQYTNISGWDIYRSEVPLLSLLMPGVASDLAQSLVNDAEQDGGYIPRWVQINNDWHGMIGDPGSIIIDDAYAYGATNFDTTSAATYINDNGTGVNSLRNYYSQYAALGYVPDGAALSEEYSIADNADAQFFKDVGQTSLYQFYLNRSQDWENNFDPANLSITSKDSSGDWDNNGQGWVEGNQSQYTWMVPFNLAGLISAMGGDSAVIPRLNTYFTQLNDGSTSDIYNYAGNEQCLSQPWTYDYAGAAWLTQETVRRIQTQLYTDTPGGLPGNDDAGALSSWYVFSCLGIYPESSGSGVFCIGSPMFASATVTTQSGHVLQINGNNAAFNNPYVQDMSVNGQPSSSLSLNVSTILNSPTTTLSFDLGFTANTSWASAASNAPPSYGVPTTTPTIVNPASASQNPVTASSVLLSALGSDTYLSGEAGLTYTWSTTSMPGGDTAPTFAGINGINASKNIQATFFGAGAYTFQVVVSNGVNAVDSSVSLNVLSTAQGLSVSPSATTVIPSGQIQCSAQEVNQFNTVLTASNVSWSVVSGGGSINSNGLFTATATPGTSVIRATDGTHTSIASVNIVGNVTTGLAAEWAFDEGAGTTTANTAPDGTNNTGTLVHGVSWVSPGKVGSSALSFNASSLQYVQVPDAPDLNPTSGLTVSTWIYPLDWNGNRRIIEKSDPNGANYGDNQYRLTAENGVLKFELYINNQPVNVTAPLPSTNSWHQIVGTWDGSMLALYVDDVEVATSAGASGALATTTGALYIGTKNNQDSSSGDFFNGEIDDVRIYDRALTASEVGILYGATLVLTGPANYLKLDSDGVHVDIWNSTADTGAAAQQVLLSGIGAMSFVGTSLNDSLTIDFSAGDPLLASGISVDGRGGTNTLNIIGAPGNNSISVNASAITVGSSVIEYANEQNLIVNGNGGGNGAGESLSVSGVAVSLPVPSGSSINTIDFSSLTITGGGTVSVPLPLSHSDRDLLVVSSLNISGGTLDLGASDMDLHAGNLTTVNALLAAGYAGGAWNGSGIDSTAADADSTHLTTLGVIVNTLYGSAGQPQFDGQDPSPGDLLVKFVYYGDTNLDGEVNGTDYSRIDAAYLADRNHPAALTGWFNGDFNYDGVINGSDYTLIDNAFNLQGASLAANVAIPSAQIADISTKGPEPASPGQSPSDFSAIKARLSDSNSAKVKKQLAFDTTMKSKTAAKPAVTQAWNPPLWFRNMKPAKPVASSIFSKVEIRTDALDQAL